jgi:hypothetical protein
MNTSPDRDTMVPDLVPDHAGPTHRTSSDLSMLSVRELIAGLAETEAALRLHPFDATLGPVVRQQALIVRELRRRRRRRAGAGTVPV